MFTVWFTEFLPDMFRFFTNFIYISTLQKPHGSCKGRRHFPLSIIRICVGLMLLGWYNFMTTQGVFLLSLEGDPSFNSDSQHTKFPNQEATRKMIFMWNS
jgi:hypothetical protein